MGIVNISYKDGGFIDLYIDYNPILKNVKLGKEQHFTEAKVKVNEDTYSTVKIFLTGLSIPHNPSGAIREFELDVASMDIGLNLYCVGDGIEHKLVISYGLSRSDERVVLVEADMGGRRRLKPLLFFRAGSDYASSKNIVARLPKFDDEASYYTKSDAEARNVDRMYRKFVAWGREEKDFVEGGSNYLVYNTHISNIQDIIQLSMMVLNRMLNKV